MIDDTTIRWLKRIAIAVIIWSGIVWFSNTHCPACHEAAVICRTAYTGNNVTTVYECPNRHHWTK